MNHYLNGVISIVALMALGGCSLQNVKPVEADFEKSVSELCSIPTDAANLDANKVARGRIVLAAITGYSYRTIDLFSAKGDVDNDVAQSLTHIKRTYLALDIAERQTTKGIFPVYRADYLDELARAGAVAAQPAIRLSRTLVTGTNADRIRQGGTILGSLLEDELYKVAYIDACGRFSAANMVDAASQAKERIALRCKSLYGLFSNNANKTAFPAAFCDNLSTP